MEASLLNDDLPLRGSTPRQTTRHFVDDLEAKKEHLLNEETSPKNPVLYGAMFSAVPSAFEDSAENLNSARDLMFGHPREGKPDSSRPTPADQLKSSRRRSPRSSAMTNRRASITRANQPLSSPYPTSENAQNIGTSAPQSSPTQYTSPPSLYDQRRDYRQYVPTNQPPMSLEHTPSPSFMYPQSLYHPPGMPDTNMMPQNLHAPYRPFLSPYHHSPDGITAAHHPFPSSPMYGLLPSNTSPPMHPSPPPISPSQHNTYDTAGTYHSIGYPPSIPTPPYGYGPPPQPYSSPPPIHPQFSPVQYSQHRFSPSSTEADRGIWWYMPNPSAASPTQQHFDSGTGPFHGPYAAPYPVHQEVQLHSLNTPPSPPGATSYSAPPVQPPSSASYSGPLESNAQPSLLEKPAIRRSYHPNPPAHRSEWVMWVGNVPSDATHDELWRFFNQPPDSTSDVPLSAGVVSIFLISRSSCAFVNYEAEYYLQRAIERFNGLPLRPANPRCPKLVCRIRKKDDDLKAGVGGQRGIGIHTKWVIDQRNKKKASPGDNDVSDASATSDERFSTTSLSDQLATGMSGLSVSSDEEPRQKGAKHSSSSGSYASTNSSILARFFPQRYFILKSLTQYDLDLSVEKGLWATQKHNEGILDQAYRTSQEVYLIFSVNKSGEFYGYAKMDGPVRRGEHQVSWATRTTDSANPSMLQRSSPLSDDRLTPGGTETLGDGKSIMFFSPGAHRLVDGSPLPVSGADVPPKQSVASPGNYITDAPTTRSNPQSAPAELGTVRKPMSITTPLLKHSLDHLVQMPREVSPPEDDFKLDPTAPARAMRSSGPTEGSFGQSGGSSGAVLDVVEEEDVEERGDGARSEGNEDPGLGSGEEGKEGAAPRDDWGESFKIQWLSTEKLSFQRTRQIRNPWNHDREVKVSRDGTELEPGAGKKLLDEWAKLTGGQSPHVPVGKVGGPTPKRWSATAQVQSAPSLVESMDAAQARAGSAS